MTPEHCRTPPIRPDSWNTGSCYSSDKEYSAYTVTARLAHSARGCPQPKVHFSSEPCRGVLPGIVKKIAIKSRIIRGRRTTGGSQPHAFLRVFAIRKDLTRPSCSVRKRGVGFDYFPNRRSSISALITDFAIKNSVSSKEFTPHGSRSLPIARVTGTSFVCVLIINSNQKNLFIYGVVYFESDLGKIIFIVEWAICVFRS